MAMRPSPSRPPFSSPLTPAMESRAMEILNSDYTHLAGLLAPLDIPPAPGQRLRPSRSLAMFNFLQRTQPSLLTLRLSHVIRDSPFMHTRAHAVTLLRPLLRSFAPAVKSNLLSCLRREPSSAVLDKLSAVLLDVVDRQPWPELLNLLLRSVWLCTDGRLQENSLLVFAQWRKFDLIVPHWERLQEGLLRCLNDCSVGMEDVQDAAFRAALHFAPLFTDHSTQRQYLEFLRSMLKASVRLFLQPTELAVARGRKVRDRLSADGKWSSFVTLLTVCLDSGLQFFHESALIVLSRFREYNVSGEELCTHSATLGLALLRLLNSSDVDVQVAAFGAVVSFTLLKIFHQSFEERFLNKLLLLLIEWEDDEDLEVHAQKALGHISAWATTSPEIMKPRLEIMVKCMAQFVDHATLQEKTRSLAMENLVDMAKCAPGMMRELSPTVMKILFGVLMKILSRPDDDTEEIYFSAEKSLAEIPTALRGSSVLPIVMEMMLEYMNAEEWEKRHAGLVTLSLITCGCSKALTMYLEEVVEIVLRLLKDSSSRVRDAANIAVAELSKDLSPQLQVQYHHIVPALLLGIGDFENFSVQVFATTALEFFSKSCTPDIIRPYLAETVNKLYDILQKPLEGEVLLEGALTALASLASSSKDCFREHYDTVMPCLRTVLSCTYESDQFVVCAKSVKCITSVAAAVGKDKFSADAEQVLQQLLSMQVMHTERGNPIRSFVMQGWVELYECLGSEFAPHMKDLMPHFLRSAKEVIKESATESITTANMLREKAAACGILSSCAIEMKENFYPWISQVVDILVPLLKFYSDDEVRMAAISAMPELLRSALQVKDKGQPDGCDMPSSIEKFIADAIKYLVQALHKEPKRKILARILNTLNGCIQVSAEHLNDFQVKLIVGGIKHVLEMISNKNLEIAKMVKVEDISIEVQDLVDKVKEELGEIINQVSSCSTTVIGIFNTSFFPSFLPFFDELFPYITTLLSNDKSAKENRSVYLICYGVLQHCQGAYLKYIVTYIPFLLNAFLDESPNVIQEAARGIGACAEFGGSQFKPYVEAVLSHLCPVLERPYMEGSDNAKAYDIAVSALGKICEFHCDSINANQKICGWSSSSNQDRPGNLLTVCAGY